MHDRCLLFSLSLSPESTSRTHALISGVSRDIPRGDGGGQPRYLSAAAAAEDLAELGEQDSV